MYSTRTRTKVTTVDRVVAVTLSLVLVAIVLGGLVYGLEVAQQALAHLTTALGH